MPDESSDRTVPSTVYTHDYYEANCHGFLEFQETKGE
jgi:hypothetical protein